jgi:hypothetical protein
MLDDDEPVFAFNGIDGTTGEPLYPPATLAGMEALAQGVRPPPQQTAVNIYRRQRSSNLLRMGGMRDGFNPRNLASSGWGVVFPQRADPAIREALLPLIEHRRRQAAAVAGHRFRELDYQLNETKRSFLGRLKVGPGAADPDTLPYYLLLVGTPEEIPWSFQQQLAVQYAVGRLCFDTAEEYARYAETVIAAETGRIVLPRRLVLFGTRHDRATEMMADHLITPLCTALSSACPVETILAGEATKERLERLLGGDETPALLFTAQHGVGFPAGDPQQVARQGALLCQNGPGGGGPIGPDVYLAGGDVADAAHPAGLIAFFYACHGAGTPRYDYYPQQVPCGTASVASPAQAPRQMAEQAFVASLPRRLLGHPAGGALAVIGHVERTWGYSFLWQGVGPQTQVFEDCLKRLLDGYPVGAALEPFTLRLGQLATELTDLLNPGEYGAPADAQELVRLWTAHNDARAYALLGDPAVRLPTTGDPSDGVAPGPRPGAARRLQPHGG